MITCVLRYHIRPGKTAEFEHYVRVWKRIIERLDGHHHGCFMPGDQPPDASRFSFPEIGRKGDDDIAVVLFTFSDLAAYDRYRREAKHDPEFDQVTAHFNETRCITSYERSFLTPLEF